MRKPDETTGKLYVHRAFLWKSDEMPAGAEFPADRATPEELQKLKDEKIVRAELYTGLEEIEQRTPAPPEHVETDALIGRRIVSDHVDPKIKKH